MNKFYVFLLAIFLFSFKSFDFNKKTTEKPSPVCDTRKVHYELKNENGQLFLQKIIFGFNGKSIKYCQKSPLPISHKNVQIFHNNYDENDKFIIKNDNFCYQAEEYYNEIQFVPIAPAGEVEQVLYTKIVKISGKWFWLDKLYDKEAKKWRIDRKLISGSNGDLEIIYHYENDIILKDEKAVYMLDNQTLTFKLLSDLNPKTTKLMVMGSVLENDWLFDEDTFYLIDNRMLSRSENITSDFLEKGFDGNFLKINIINDVGYNCFVTFGSDIVWIYENRKLSSPKFYPIVGENMKYLPSDLLFYKGKYFTNSNYHHSEGVEVSEVKNLEKLTSINNYLKYDGEFYYGLEYDEKKRKHYLKKVTIQNNSEYKKTLYQQNNFITFSDEYVFENKKIPLKTAVKNLTFGFAFNDKFKINQKIISNPADFQTMEFIGSVVKKDDNCNADAVYLHYYKDKNSVYVVDTELDSFHKINYLNHKELSENNFYETEFIPKLEAQVITIVEP